MRLSDREEIIRFPARQCRCGIQSVKIYLSRLLKRDGGVATQDAAKIAGREDAKKMKNMRQPDKPHFGQIMVGQNVEKATQY
jgi:hypothetical protein